MKKQIIIIIIVFCLSILIFSGYVSAYLSFSDDFSGSDFSNWDNIVLINGDNPIKSGGLGVFVTTTGGGSESSVMWNSSIGVDSNNLIIMTGDFALNEVPTGGQGNGNVFVMYCIDQIGQNSGNIGVGFDSTGWTMWIGGYPTYTQVFGGTAPTSNNSYNLILTIDNVAGTAILDVNGTETINHSQTQFTDNIHDISIWVGQGENWGSYGNTVYMDNFLVEIITQGETTPTPTPEITPTPTPEITPTPTPNIVIIQDSIDYTNIIILLFLLAINIILCIKRIPILGLVVGFLTIVIIGTVFINDSVINVNLLYFAIVIAFSTMIINGLDFRRKK